MSMCNRNRIMTGVKFLFRVTLRRPDLVAEIYHLREPQKIPLVMSQDETRRLLAVASSLKVRVLLSVAYGCGRTTRDSRTAKRRWWAAHRFAQLNFRRPEVLNRGRSGKPSRRCYRTTMR